MIKLISILIALGIVGYSIYWLCQLKRKDDIDKMSPDELVDAIIRREISILEVPQQHREPVNKMIEAIQKELDKTRIE